MHCTVKYPQHIPWWCWIALVIVTIEVLSYSGWVFPTINIVAFLLISIGTLLLSLKQLDWGVAIVVTELIIGSKGYLFSYQIFGFPISIRLAIFFIVGIASIVWMVREHSIAILHWKFLRPYYGLLIMIILGTAIGITSNELQIVFLDVNGYLFFGAAIPIVQALRTEQQWKKLQQICLIAVIALTVKTIITVLLFSHDIAFLYSLPGIYKWIRDTGIGEITRFPSGFVRVFFQSHLIVISVFFVLFAYILSVLKKNTLRNTFKQHLWAQIAIIVMGSIIVFSYSRSFWVSALLSGIVVGLWYVLQCQSWKNSGRMIAQLIITTLGVALLATIIIRIPLPGQKDISLVGLVSDRTTDISSEPAAASRWQLMNPLLKGIQQHPFLGSGFGATITYISNDPRIRESRPDGQYTTYAFEWGYLDLLFKVGIVGTVLYIYFLWNIIHETIKREWKKTSNTSAFPMYSMLLMMLLITHTFTPYLNHPLGIGMLLYTAVGLSRTHNTD